MNGRDLAACAASVAIAALPAGAALAQNSPQPPRELLLLPSLPGTESCDAWDVNGANVAVGSCGDMAVRWTLGPDGSASVEALAGSLVLTAPDGTTAEASVLRGMATAINAAGQISGQLTALIGSRAITRAALWQDGAWRDLGVPAGAVSGAARDIDEHGNVIGSSGSPPRATVWSRTGIAVLPQLDSGTGCIAFAGNDVGEVVGECDFDDSGKPVPVVWKKGSVYELRNARTPGSIDFARSINERGLIGGIAGLAALVWNANNPGKSAPVASTGAVNGINDRDVMVGYVGVNGGDGSLAAQAAWWRNPGQAPVLMFPGYLSSFARSINDAGVVVGNIRLEDGSLHAFLAR